MKFKQYLQEEYFARNRSFEIFKNPSQTELQKLFRESKNSIRIAIDEKDKTTWYAFPSNLLHQYAIETMIGEGLDNTVFRAGEVYLTQSRTNIFIYYGSYSITNGKAKFKSIDYNKKDFSWLKDKFKFLNKEVIYDEKVDEEYVLRKKELEIHKNPSFKDIVSITKSSPEKFKKSIRLLIDLVKNVYYVAPVNYLHDNMIKDLKMKEEDTYILRSIARIENGKLIFKYIYDNAGIDDWESNDKITDLFKKYGVKIDLTDMRQT